MLSTHLPPQRPINLEFEKLKYSVRDTASAFGGFGPASGKTHKVLVKEVSGAFKSGQLTAIMGPSGAGKSTLMNILAGYKNQNVEGSIHVNGAPRDNAKFRKMSCYIMQDDVLLPQLTVLEAMRYAAQLKLPRKTSRTQKELVISETLDLIGLTQCKNVKTSSVSGGQRKRLAIALELINNPPVMFFDEPTSGLDSASCYSCVSLLKSLAKGGRTIIATIHQPSARIFEQFDSLYLLSAGQCLFSGPVKSLVPFFRKQGLECPAYHNPADFAIEVASGDYGEQWIPILVKATEASGNSAMMTSYTNSNASETPLESEMIEEKSSGGRDSPNPKDDRQTTVSIFQPLESGDGSEDADEYTRNEDGKVGRFFNQFTTLLKRSFVCVSRDMMLTHLRFAATVLVGLLIGAIYHDAGNDASKCFNNAGNLFFGLLFMVFASMMCTVLTFPLERGVVVREHLNCWYSLKAYFLARTFADLPFQLFFPLLYSLITYFMTEQPHEAFRFWIVCGFVTLISLVAQSIGLLIGAACSIQSAVFIGPVTTIPIFLFSGFFVTMNTVPAYLRWVSWFSYARYSFQSTLTAVYGFGRGSLKCSEAYCHFKNPKKFLETLDAVDIPVGEHAMFMIIILISLRLLSYWALRFKINSSRK